MTGWLSREPQQGLSEIVLVETFKKKESLMVDIANEPISIAPGVHWVGKRQKGEVFFSNPYLRVFQGSIDGRERTFSMLIDPGSSSDFPVVRAKVDSIIGGIKRLSAIFINHQDPDVGSSANVIMAKHSPKASIVCSEETWRLIVHFNLPRDRMVATNGREKGFRTPTGHIIVPVPTPFCHFVGCTALYDPETRVLFSGDLFGSLTDTKAEGLWGDKSDWAGMRAFHQAFMPTGVAVRNAMKTIRALDPPPLIIAPQHGRLIQEEHIEFFINKLENLPCGVDNIEDRNASPETINAWNSVLRRIISTAGSTLGSSIAEAYETMKVDEELAEYCDMSGHAPEIKSMGRAATERIIHILTSISSKSASNIIKYEAISAAEEMDLPTPQIQIEEVGDEDTLVSDSNELLFDEETESGFLQ